MLWSPSHSHGFVGRLLRTHKGTSLSGVSTSGMLTDSQPRAKEPSPWPRGKNQAKAITPFPGLSPHHLVAKTWRGSCSNIRWPFGQQKYSSSLSCTGTMHDRPSRHTNGLCWKAIRPSNRREHHSLIFLSALSLIRTHVTAAIVLSVMTRSTALVSSWPEPFVQPLRLRSCPSMKPRKPEARGRDKHTKENLIAREECCSPISLRAAVFWWALWRDASRKPCNLSALVNTKCCPESTCVLATDS